MLILGIFLQIASLAVRGWKLGPGGTWLVGTTIVLSLAAAGLALGLPTAACRRLSAFARSACATPARITALLLLGSFATFGVDVFVQQPDAFDERGLLTGAPVIAAGGIDGFVTAYRENAWLGPQHPPFPPLVYALAWHLGATTATPLRFVSVLFATLAVVVVWRVLERFLNRPTAALGAALLLTSPLVVRIGSAIGNDPPLLLFFWLAILCGLRLVEAPSNGRALALVAVLGLGVLTKYTMVLVGPVLLTLPWATGRPWPPRRSLAILLSVVVIAAIWLAALHAMGALDRQIAKLGSLAGISFHDRRFALASILVHVPAALGIYSAPLVLRGLVALRPRRTRGEAWLLVWILAVAVPVTLTSPVARYFLPAFPAVTAILAVGLRRASDEETAVRAVLLLASLCVVTLAYYGWADLAVLMNPF